jgi:threonine-phosphate decarboxylase
MKDHGGNIYAYSRNGFPSGSIIDFSASINPLGMPRTAGAAIRKHMRLVPHYPEPHAETLSAVIAKHFRLRSSSVLCGNGSTELIFLIPKALKPKRVLVTSPAFSEYEKACRMTGAAIRYCRLRPGDDFSIDPGKFIEAMQGRDGSLKMTGAGAVCDMAFLCNPNNPTGRLLRKRDVLKIADAARELRCLLVVDEAFIDFCPNESVLSSVAKNPYLIVIRSMTKFYALAGLRLGFGVFPSAIASRIKSHKEPWSVNSLAAAAGRAVISDDAYRDASHAMIRREKQYLEQCLDNLQIPYVASDSNYYLLYMKKARLIVRTLEKKGLLLRDCSNFKWLGPGYVRIAVRTRKENSLLMHELGKVHRQS